MRPETSWCKTFCLERFCRPVTLFALCSLGSILLIIAVYNSRLIPMVGDRVADAGQLIGESDEIANLKKEIAELQQQVLHLKRSVDTERAPKKESTSFPSVKFRNEESRKRILVTGGAGFVGSHLVDRLMTDGHEVIALDNFFTGRRRNVEQWIGHPNFEMVHHDIVNPYHIEVDQIYHLASPASPPHYMYNPVKTLKTNTIGTINLLGLARFGSSFCQWASRRIAICNLDWDRLRADDLMIVLNSFKPETGSILSVGVYLSDFGAERLEEEEKNGPALPKLNEDDDDIKTDEKSKEMIRAYQLERLRYYYAVCECDSEDTAIVIYEGCDGVEYETSGVRFDLRFIPNEMEFDENRLRERVTTDNIDVGKYKPKRFESLALSNCNTKLTWDENDPERTLCVTEAFKEQTLDKFDNLIAPPSDSDDEDSTNRLHALLTEETVNTGRREDNESLRVEWKSLKESEGVDQIDDPLNKDTQKKEKKGITPFQEYLERRKQKRKERKAKLAEMKKERKMEIQEETKTSATEKRQKVITKGDSDTLDLGDGRFAALFTDSAFAIDKTHSKFRGGNLADKQVQEKRKRNSTTDKNMKCRETKGQTLNADSAAEESVQESTTTLVEKLKKKAKKLGPAV